MYEVTDMRRTGLILRIHATGLKSYYYRHANKTKKLGDFDHHTFHDIILEYNKLTGTSWNITVNEFIESDFMNEIENLAPATARDSKAYLKKFIRPIIVDPLYK